MFGRPRADGVESLRPRGLASAAGVWRVRSGGDSAVLKLIALDAAPHPRWLSQPEPTDPYYWRREPTVYASGLLEPFGAPRCRASVERRDGSVALWLDDAGASPAWTPALLGGAARRLGRAQAVLAADPPDAPWLARDWSRTYLELHGIEPDAAVLERFDAAPQTLCHHDLHPENVLGQGGEVVVDWAYCGLGPLGLDPGVLVADGVADGAFAPGLADEASAAVWEGYAAGLREGGFGGPLDDVRFVYAQGTALRLSWLPRGDRPAWDATIDFLERLASEA